MHKHLLSRPSIDSLRSTQFDLAVIGGGITGAGVAQDAALRGLRVVVLEKGDFASGTSSKSTKLIHGGLRYLKNGQVGVVRESLRERQLQMQLAPHMVWSVPFVVPTYRGSWFKNFTLRLGLCFYDLLAGFRNRRFHKRINAREVRRLCPGIRTEGLTGGFLYEDCRTDDARHTLDVLKSACENGATVVNYAKVIGVVRGPVYRNAQAVVISMRDARGEWSAPFAIKASAIVNATGVWTGEVGNALGITSKKLVVPAKGIHITVDRATLPIDSAMIVPSVHDGRFCFAVPWYDSVVIGTTDTEYNGNLDDVRAEADEIQYVLDAVNALFPNAQLTVDKVTGSYAGLRPLIKDPSKSSTADLSRGHSLEISPDGIISIAGGKLTTYRPMAESVVDVVCKRLREQGARVAAGRIGPKRTHEMRLGGWSGHEDVKASIAALRGEALALGLDAETADYLPVAYGARASEVLTIVRRNRALGQKIAANHPYIMAQVEYAVTHEGAITVDDVLSRRIRLSITDAASAAEVAGKVAFAMGDLLGWDVNVHTAQVRAFLERLGA